MKMKLSSDLFYMAAKESKDREIFKNIKADSDVKPVKKSSRKKVTDTYK